MGKSESYLTRALSHPALKPRRLARFGALEGGRVGESEDGGAHWQSQEAITSCLILYMKSKCENGVCGAVQKRKGVRTWGKNRSNKEGA